MQWPQASPDFNPIKDLYAIVKKIYDGGREYNGKSAVWEAIQ